jgi:sec-independent protein translocase protein TatC
MSSETTGAGLIDDAYAEDADDRSRMSFLEHLDELRRRLLYSFYALLACCAVSFYFWEPLFAYFIQYFSENGGQLVYTQPMAGFMFSLKLSALAGLLIASPFLFTQLWLFVAPGLYAREKKVVIPFVFFATLFFIGGAYFGHVVAYPSMWRFFASYAQGPLTYMPALDQSFSLYVKTILGLGIVFQMPMLVFFLARFNVVTAGFMIRKFKYAVLIIIVIAAVITPSSDPVNLAIFSAPMLVLYIISIGVAWVFGKKQVKSKDDE